MRQRPHKARKETRGQSQHDGHGRPVKAGATFDQLLAKNASKKTVPHDRSTKKPRSPAKTTGAYVEHQKEPRGRSAVRTVRGSGADGSRVRRVS
jgi:hypothetical protein